MECLQGTREVVEKGRAARERVGEGMEGGNKEVEG